MTRRRDRRKHVSKATKHRIDIAIRHRTDIAINNSSRNSIDPLVNSRVRTNLNIKLRALCTIRNLNFLCSNRLLNSIRFLNSSMFLSSNRSLSNRDHSSRTLSRTHSNSNSVRLHAMAYLSHIQTYLM
jgi:hypothetical protein